MLRRHAALVLIASLAACAQSGTLLNNDAAPDIADEDAADVGFELAPFDVPRFDVPPPDVAPPDVADDLATDVALDADASVDVAPDLPPRRVEHCYLVDPRAVDVAPGATSANVSVAVFAAGITPGMGRGAGVTVEIGVGDGTRPPLDAMSGWTWTAAAWERDIDGRGAAGSREYDQYRGTFAAPATPGEYTFAARARIESGPWTACDFVQTTAHDYAAAHAGRASVFPASAPRVGYCNLQFPRTLSLMASSTGSQNVFGRVFASGVTNRGCTNVPTASEMSAQWGYGPVGTWPSSAGWTWSDGRYNAHRDSTNPVVEGNCANIEYQSTPRAPVDCNTRDYGWRFRLGAGPWTYCRWAPPADGAPTTPPFDTWDPSLAGTMTITGCL